MRSRHAGLTSQRAPLPCNTIISLSSLPHSASLAWLSVQTLMIQLHIVTSLHFVAKSEQRDNSERKQAFVDIRRALFSKADNL